MKVLICGMDGYLGWPLALRLLDQDRFQVLGLDNFSRRSMVGEVGSDSAIPIVPMEERLAACREVFGDAPTFYDGDLRDYEFTAQVLEDEEPDAIVHLGEMPSAPYSMADASRAYFTQENNVLGTLNLLFAMRDFAPSSHLVKLGTMGEYGTPNIDIPEGFFEIEYNGRKDSLPFPRQPGSLYHLSKVHDSFNVMFGCKVWNLRSTDIMQGVVYGTRTDQIALDARFSTRFDIDAVFGTAINRFCAQAVIGHPITPYGRGHQKRGFIALRDSLACMTLALKYPPSHGEYRTFNQFDMVYDISYLAEVVATSAAALGLRAGVSAIDNPRIEAEEHYYNPESKKLRSLGFQPEHELKEETELMLKDLIPQRARIHSLEKAIDPSILWDPRPGKMASSSAPGES
ncbi:MAG: NAD-dependent epimerase/dehydratase family protein [Thermoplasmata archaeon]